MRTLAIVASILYPVTAHADDAIFDTYPGMRLVHRTTPNQDLWLATIDLCAPGIHVRTTSTSERGQTVPSFGASIGAQLAVNGDFFYGAYDTDGPAMHAGAQWSGVDHDYVAPLTFGAHRSELLSTESTVGLPPWAREVVSGHPSLLVGGVAVNDATSLCLQRHPRTAAGLDASRSHLYLLVADGRSPSRIGLTCSEMTDLMRELGASDAVNLDGGGSSTMWVPWPGVLNHPSDGSPRTVGNHLAIFAGGSDQPSQCPNQWPQGWLDAVSCDGIVGWAQDPDAPTAPIDVHLYLGGPAGSGVPAVGVTANQTRSDLCGAIGSCDHGYSFPIPAALRDGQPHEVYAYGIDSSGGTNVFLPRAATTFTCDPLPDPPPPPTGNDGSESGDAGTGDGGGGSDAGAGYHGPSDPADGGGCTTSGGSTEWLATLLLGLMLARARGSKRGSECLSGQTTKALRPPFHSSRARKGGRSAFWFRANYRLRVIRSTRRS